MFLVFLASVGLVAAAPVASSDWKDLIKDANDAKAQISALPENQQNAAFLVMGILGNSSLTDEQKKSTIDTLMKNASTDAKKEVDIMTSKTIKYNDWLKDRLKNEDPAVQAVINKVVGLMVNKSFIMSTDAEKETQLSSIVQGLSEAQQAALKKIDADSDAKEKELELKEID